MTEKKPTTEKKPAAGHKKATSTHAKATRKPADEPVRGVGPTEERMYEHIKEEAKRDHRYAGREEEVAARTVLAHHKAAHHPKGK